MDLDIDGLIIKYKAMNDAKKKIEQEQKSVRNLILEFVYSNGNYESEHGKATLVERAGSVDYDDKAVDALAKSWVESKDPIMQSCGQMLIQHRTEKEPVKYLDIR